MFFFFFFGGIIEWIHSLVTRSYNVGGRRIVKLIKGKVTEIKIREIV